MGYRHTKEEILEAALGTAVDEGLSRLSFGRVAKRMGISDRTVVYYFPTKDDLIGEVVLAMGGRLQATLAEALVDRAADHVGLVRAAWPIVATPEADSVFALFFEANGLATAGREPFSSLVPTLVEMWISWASEFVDAPPDLARTEAATAIALIDGLLLLRLLVGSDAADRAAARLGVI